MQFLGTHIARVHGMTAKQYREEFDLPASTPLASASFCEQARRRIVERIALGDMTYEHLPKASEAAQDAGRGYIASEIRSQRSGTAKRVRPGDTHSVPDTPRSVKRREAQRRRRSQQREQE